MLLLNKPISHNSVLPLDCNAFGLLQNSKPIFGPVAAFLTCVPLPKESPKGKKREREREREREGEKEKQES